MPVDGELGRPAVGAGPQAHGDAAVEGELQRVGQEVENDLLPHVAIDRHRMLQRRAVDREREAGSLDGGAEGRGELGGEGGKIERFEVRPRAAGLDAREVEQSIDQLQQPHAVAVRDRDELAAVLARVVSRRGQYLFQWRQHQRERRAELVADVGEEQRLGAVDLGQRLGAAALLLVGLGAGDRGGDLAGYQLEERGVGALVEAKRVQAGDQQPHAAGAAG
jgi:hypothetical protein